MSIELKVTAILFLLLIILLVLIFVKKGKMSIKYSLVWLLPCFILILFITIPIFLDKVTKFFGFQTSSNMIFALLIGFMMIIDIVLTLIVSRQKEQIRNLIQEVSLLKSKK